MKTLILYYSNTSHTAQVANAIKKLIDADIDAIRVEEPYGDSLMARSKEESMGKCYPAILPIEKNLADYDALILAAPIWWLDIATPIHSFLEKHDLKGKAVYPVITTGFDCTGVAEKFKEAILKAHGEPKKPLIVPFENAWMSLPKEMIEDYLRKEGLLK